jgi:3-oxoadipate enol-lactonase
MMELFRKAGDGPAFANYASVFMTEAYDLTEAARRIRVPTLVVSGSVDSVVSPGFGAQLAAAIPGSRFELVDGADHFETIGNDQRVMKLVSAFLAEDARAPD